MKRILIFIFLFLLVGGGVWYFFIRPKGDSSNPITTVFQSFFPLSDNDGNFDGVITEGDTANNSTDAARFTQITPRAIAGYSIFSLTTNTTTPNPDPKLTPIVTTAIDHYIRYVSRQNGYVYEIKNSESPIQVTNILIPNIYEAVFANNNTVALLRFLKSDNQTIATYSVPIPPLNTDGRRTQKPGVYFSDNIDSLVVSPDNKQIAQLTNEVSAGVISTVTPTNTLKKDLLRTPFKEWILLWPIQTTVYAQTKAAATVNGFLYRVDSAAGRLNRIIGDVPGLTTSISPNGEYILYSQSVQNSFITKLFNTKTGSTTTINLSILPEKCAWYTNNDIICAGNTAVAEAVYPDAWYAGITRLQDQLYRIDTRTNTYSVLYDGTSQLFDMTQLTLDEGKNLLYFIDKPTGLLWKFNLN